MHEEINCEERGTAAVAWLKGTKHRYYEDRYRMLSNDIPLVQQKSRGEVFAVFDGIGSAPKGRDAAQEMADQLIRFYRESNEFPASREGMCRILMEGNQTILGWGCMPETDRPLGGCAGTVAWIHGQSAEIFHAGDTVAYLIRDGGLVRQLTRLHEENGAIYRYFGLGAYLEIDMVVVPLEEGERLLLVSDGVTKAFDMYEITKIVEDHSNRRRAVGELVRRARSRGSSDDITAMIIEIEELEETV